MRRLSLARGARAAAAFAIVFGTAPVALADSIQRPGLTMGIPEGFGRTPGF